MLCSNLILIIFLQWTNAEKVWRIEVVRMMSIGAEMTNKARGSFLILEPGSHPRHSATFAFPLRTERDEEEKEGEYEE